MVWRARQSTGLVETFAAYADNPAKVKKCRDGMLTP
jgi:hypothetical protein